MGGSEEQWAVGNELSTPGVLSDRALGRRGDYGVNE